MDGCETRNALIDASSAAGRARAQVNQRMRTAQGEVADSHRRRRPLFSHNNISAMAHPTPPQRNTTKDLCIPFATWRSLVRAADTRTPPPTPTGAPPAPAPAAAPPPVTPNRLPPGMVLDEDGKPCKVCNSWRSWAKIGKKRDHPSSAPNASSSPSTTGTAASFASLAAATATIPTPEPVPEPTPPPTRPADCPPDVETLGRATWTFLHTTAAYYPVHPTPAQQQSMRGLIRGLTDFYPCSYCRKDFADKVRLTEPDVRGREGLSRWMCERHNEVNERLGKEVFDCGKVMERWKDGPADGRCD